MNRKLKEENLNSRKVVTIYGKMKFTQEELNKITKMYENLSNDYYIPIKQDLFFNHKDNIYKEKFLSLITATMYNLETIMEYMENNCVD